MMLVPKPDAGEPSDSAELAMLDVYMPMMKSAAIISAGRLGLFYSNWLTAAGFGSISRIDLDPREKGLLILARR